MVAALFFMFLLSKVSIFEIIQIAPTILGDPEHSSATIFEKLYELRQSTSIFFVIGLIGFIVLLITIILDKRRLTHKKFYLIIASGISIFSFAFSWRCFNLVMTPLFFSGSISYILCESKEKFVEFLPNAFLNLWFLLVFFLKDKTI